MIRRLEGSWVDGIILDSAARLEDEEYLQFLADLGGHKKRISVVSLEREVPGGTVQIGADRQYEGARIATRHLVDCGCREIAHIAGPPVSCVAGASPQGVSGRA